MDSPVLPTDSTVKTETQPDTKLRELLEPYTYLPPTPQSLPRRSSRNSARQPVQYSETKQEDTDAELFEPLTPPPSSRKRKTFTQRKSSKKTKQEFDSDNDDDDCLPVPPLPAGRNVKKRTVKKPKRGYAAPEVYQHLNGLPDHLADELDVMFCGINPGKLSAQSGWHYAHPVNHFWRCLHQGGFTPERLPPSDGHKLPQEHNVGLTNLVARPSSEAGELKPAELRAAVPALLVKARRHRPRVVCFVGKLIWDAVVQVLRKCVDVVPVQTLQNGKGFPYEQLQPYKLVHAADAGNVRETLFFVVPSTSGRVISHQLGDKVKLFAQLKHHVEKIKVGECDTGTFSTVDLSLLELPTDADTKDSISI